jgi:DNA-binding LacI/PurR family transcriptional regulator
MLISMITQRELARQLGLTQAAVSLALSGRGRVAPATRERVREAARRLGWQADPALAALSRRRWEAGIGPIAYLGSRVAEEDPRFDQYWLALRARARSQGVQLHHIDPRLRGDAAALAGELARLGIHDGVLVAQDNRSQEPWRLDWERWSVVHCGLYVTPGPGDVVCADLLAAPADAVARLAGRGRIAVILPLTPGALSEQMLFAPLHDLARRGLIALWSGSPAELDQALPWLRAQDAQQVLGYGDWMAEWLRRGGVRLPVACLAISEGRRQRGSCIPFTAVAEQAVDLLLAKIAAGERGTGARRIHLVPMPWRERA